MASYQNLSHLLHCEQEAEAYFTLLPDSVREQLSYKADCVHSLAALREYAESCMRGHEQY